MKSPLAGLALFAVLSPVRSWADSSHRQEIVDLSRLELVRTIEKGWTHSLAPGGQAFALFDGNVVRLFDTSEGREIQALNGHSGLIHDSGWSRDGRWIATSGYDAAVRVWEVSTGKTVLQLYPHAGYACSVAFSDDGKWLATGGSEDGLIKIHDLTTGHVVRPISTPDASIYAMVFTPDGRYLVVNHSLTNRADSSLRIFKTADGSELRNSPTGPVTSFAVSRNGRTLAYSTPRGSIVLLETGGWTEKLRMDGHPVGASSIAFHPFSRFLATAGRDGTVRIWDTETSKLINTLNIKSEVDSRIAFCSDGVSLLVSSSDGIVRVYRRPEALRVNAWQDRPSDPSRVVPSPAKEPTAPPVPPQKN